MDGLHRVICLVHESRSAAGENLARIWSQELPAKTQLHLLEQNEFMRKYVKKDLPLVDQNVHMLLVTLAEGPSFSRWENWISDLRSSESFRSIPLLMLGNAECFAHLPELYGLGLNCVVALGKSDNKNRKLVQDIFHFWFHIAALPIYEPPRREEFL